MRLDRRNRFRVASSRVHVAAAIATGLLVLCVEAPTVASIESDRPSQRLTTPLRIGALADSQLQTRHTRDQVALYSGKQEDHVVEVSLRPPALNELSEDLLEELLGELAKSDGLDMILYLGDAANNGCADELDRAFSVAHKVRHATGVPIYFVVGNHDYLGAGNTTRLTDRARLCDRSRPWTGRSIREAEPDPADEKRDKCRDQDLSPKNAQLAGWCAEQPSWRCDWNGFEETARHGKRGRQVGIENLPVTKVELMQRISCFNRQNASLLRRAGRKWIYQDSFDGKGMLRRCVPERPKEGWIDEQHRNQGCFLTGILVADDPAGTIQIVLADTSDYWDRRPVASFIGWQYFGTMGWISTRGEGSQASWLAANLGKDSPAIRVLASHYSPEDLGWMATWSWPAGIAERIREALPEPVDGQYWLHAHEHRWKKVHAFRGYEVFGVGSTTDTVMDRNGELEPPHAAIVTIDGGSLDCPKRIETKLECKPVNDALGEFARLRFGEPTYSPVRKQRWRDRLLDGNEYADGEEANVLLGSTSPTEAARGPSMTRRARFRTWLRSSTNTSDPAPANRQWDVRKTAIGIYRRASRSIALASALPCGRASWKPGSRTDARCAGGIRAPVRIGSEEWSRGSVEGCDALCSSGRPARGAPVLLSRHAYAEAAAEQAVRILTPVAASPSRS